MSDMNEKTEIDRTGLTIETDPDGDARRLSENPNETEGHQPITRGVERVGGGDAGKVDKGVRIVRRK